MAQPKIIATRKSKKSDVVNLHTGQTWVYSETVKDHFFHPRNLLLEDPDTKEYDASGSVGSPACGDIMTMWAKVDPKTDRVTSLKWRTFGCASAIASTSMFSVMITENGGMPIADALKIKPQDIIARLEGLPDRKIHCSVLADKAFRKTLNEYFRNTNQHHRVMAEGSKIIDKFLNVTERDIEEAVLDGARNIQGVKEKLKAGVGDPDAIPEIEQLIRFYSEKHNL